MLHSRINYAYRRLREYMDADHTWGARHAGVLRPRPVAYFSAEFGLHESLPVYSGGLGVLAGDHIKSASDLGIPLVGVGLFYGQGYFRQRLDRDGWQQEEYLETDVNQLPMEPAIGTNGQPVVVQIDTRSGSIRAKVWRVKVGRCDLFLLDSDVEGNAPEDRELTSRLYGGDGRVRIRQELLLGVGGLRALRALGITPGVLHLNEGHSGFAVLEAIRSRMEDEGIGFDNAVPRVSREVVFTTHTPVPAGHDRFDADLIEEHLGPLREALGLSHEQPSWRWDAKIPTVIEAFLHDRAGLEAFAARQCGFLAAWRGLPRHVDRTFSRQSRRRGAHRTHHQRRARPHVAGAADVSALRPPSGHGLARAQQRSQDLGRHRECRRRRALGDASQPEIATDSNSCAAARSSRPSAAMNRAKCCSNWNACSVPMR